MGEETGPDAGAIAAIVLGIAAWVCLLAALFFLQDAFFFLFLGLVLGAIALFLGLRARRDAAEVAAVAGTAGLVAVYGAAVGAMLAAAVYATGVLVFLVFVWLLVLLFARPSYSVSSPGCDCSGCDCDCCTDCGCGASDCGGCGGCGSCGGCGGGCGGCGGCGCAALCVSGGAARHAPPVAPLGWKDRFAHHPDAPEYEQDVFRLRGWRLCIGCFVTYPVFLLGIALSLVAPPPLAWSAAILAGLAAASAQLLSSAGLARRRWTKTGVKSLLGAGLALYVWGVREAPWPAWARVLALAFALALALASALPRARRMRKARAASGCACQQAAAREA